LPEGNSRKYTDLPPAARNEVSGNGWRVPFVGHPVRSLRLITPVLVCLLLAGCGGGEAKQPDIVNPTAPDLNQTAYVEMSRGLYGDSDPGKGGGEPVLTQKQVDCFSHGLLDAFKVQGLIDIHVLTPAARYIGRPMAIPAAEATKWIDALAKCADLHDYVFDTVKIGAAAVNPDVVAASSESTWEEARTCVHEKVSDTAIRGALQQQLTARSVKGADATAFDTCLAIAYHPVSKPPIGKQPGARQSSGVPTNPAG
jgi:hypothetical protein